MAQAKKRRSKRQSLKKDNVISVEAKTKNHDLYIKSILNKSVTFCIGPAGTGKSFISAGMAANYLYSGAVDKIIVTRPLVCTGKDIGSLPGEVLEKIAPYLLPMQEHFRHFLGQAYYGHYYNERKIRFEPLELMRGATFDNSFMILDEAQNCTFEQIKMFITRMGTDSKIIINGDIRQTDLRNKSGLSLIIDRLSNVDGVGTVELTTEDIQRNGILGKILNALERC